MNNNGFGLKEMIIFSCALFICLIFTAISIVHFYKDLDQSQASLHYSALENELLEVGKQYIKKNKKTKVTSKVLIEEEYIEQLKDENGENCTGYVRYSFGDYYSYIKCSEYKTENY